ncbi:MAG TPA: VOC family protein [Croceibacterium sp.]|nr:VOC family protein [Croceibacterium sp.]
MSMYSHVMIGTDDPEQARAFYDATFAALGIPGRHTPRGAFYGSPETGFFGVAIPRDEQAATHANGGTIGLKAGTPAQVDAWHQAALANGGTCEGPPGPREYGAPMYGAYVRDPVGNKLCAFALLAEDAAAS